MLRRLATGDEWWRPLPPGASADALRILAARGVRAFGDGFVALLLPIYLVERGFSALAVGTIVTGTLVGTALMTLWVGWHANRRRAGADDAVAREQRGSLPRLYGFCEHGLFERHKNARIARCRVHCADNRDDQKRPEFRNRREAQPGRSHQHGRRQ